MQQEDDLRGLARVMDFMRAISILFVGINVYWFCYSTLKEWGVTFEVIDKILWNFQRTTGLFSSVLWTKLFSVVFLALSCIGTKGVKEEKITWTKIHCSLAVGVTLFFLNWWLLELPLPHTADAVFYIATLSAGYICMLMAGIRLSIWVLIEVDFSRWLIVMLCRFCNTFPKRSERIFAVSPTT